MSDSYKEKATILIKALGGKENINSLMCCATRLRIDLNDMSLLDEKTIKQCGAYYVMKLGGGAIQVIWGPTANLMEEEMKAQLKAN